MTAQPTAAAPAPLALLSAGNLVIGTGAFILAGLLTGVGADLKVSVAAAGQGMTAYALSTAVLAPLLLVWTGGLHRKHAMALALVVFALGNLLCASANDLATLLAGRVLMGAGAMFTPVAAGLAVVASAPAQRGKALSLVFLGISLSYVIGLPLGTWLAAKDSWRLPVQGVAAASLVVLALLMWRVPGSLKAPGASFKGAGALLRQPEVARTLGLTLLYFTAIFSLFSYVGPVLHALGPLSPAQVSITLLVVGVAGVAGTLVGGWGTDRFGPVRTLRAQLLVFVVAQAAVPFTAGAWAPMLLVFFVWGVAGFGMMPGQQSRLAAASPAQAPLLLSLNTSMLYLGTAVGSVVGGAAGATWGFAQVAWVGVPFLLAGLFTLRQKTPHQPEGMRPRP